MDWFATESFVKLYCVNYRYFLEGGYLAVGMNEILWNFGRYKEKQVISQDSSDVEK